jgi:hypothetical protein
MPASAAYPFRTFASQSAKLSRLSRNSAFALRRRLEHLLRDSSLEQCDLGNVHDLN